MGGKVITVHEALIRKDPRKYEKILDLRSATDIKAAGVEAEGLKKELDDSRKEVEELKGFRLELDKELDKVKDKLIDAGKEIQKLKEDRKEANKKIMKLKEKKKKKESFKEKELL